MARPIIYNVMGASTATYGRNANLACPKPGDSGLSMDFLGAFKLDNL